MKKKLIIAHRGEHSNAVENTIESFKNAIREGADMIELDVRRTKDDLMVVNHNRNIRGKTIRNMKWNEY